MHTTFARLNISIFLGALMALKRKNIIQKMKITDSNLSNQILEMVENKVGNIYFFDVVAVIELNEGIHFDMNNSKLIIDELKLYYGNRRPFSILSNRINSYSIEVIKLMQFKRKIKNLAGYAVVAHNAASIMNAELENLYCKTNNICFTNINEAFIYVQQKVTDRTNKSTNLYQLDQ